jgi:RNA polymerase sigma-70 factor (ECF subfamily)
VARSARDRLFGRYQPAVSRYLQAAVRDPHVADDLVQEFALRLARGDFQSVTPEKGRFRNFLRTVLIRLVIDHRRQTHRVVTGGTPVTDLVDPDPKLDYDRAFVAVWRAELLEAAWARLQREQQESGRFLFTLLRARVDDPDASSEALAARLSAVEGRLLTAGWVRKRLMEARSRFTDFLVAEVAGSLEHPTRDAVAEELADLELLTSCQEALARWQHAE